MLSPAGSFAAKRPMPARAQAARRPYSVRGRRLALCAVQAGGDSARPLDAASRRDALTAAAAALVLGAAAPALAEVRACIV